MPQGNAHTIPHGYWFFNPSTNKLSHLVLQSCGKLVLLGFCLTGVHYYRSMSWKYTYNSFIGRTMTLGTTSIDTHEPLSVEEIDKLKAEQAERKRLSQGH